MSFQGDLPAEGSGLDYSDIGADQRKGAAQLPLLDSVGDAARTSFFGATRDAGNWLFNSTAPSEDASIAPIDPKEWQTKYPDLGLTFTSDMGQAQAQMLVDHRTDELRRQYVIDHSPDTLMAKTARGLTEFAVSAIDPLNIAAAFVPGVGETRAGLWAAKYGKTVGRAMEGAVAGATGMAALQPLQATEAAMYQDHYGPMDAFMNVAFGAALGGGLHAGVGAFSDFLARASPETREAALRASVGAGERKVGPSMSKPVLATDEGLAGHRIDTATKAGPLDSLPVINHEDFALATREAQLKQDVATHDQGLTELKAKVDALQPENPGVRQKAARPQRCRKAGAFRRHDAGRSARTQPAARPNPDRYEPGETEGRGAAHIGPRGHGGAGSRAPRPAGQCRRYAGGSQIPASADCRPEFHRPLCPVSHRPRAPGLFGLCANGREPSTVAARPDVQAYADEIIKTGDDPKAELADAQTRLSDYKAQGILTDSEHAAFTDANAAADEAHKTRSDAADAAARCLFLHP
jgi:hypothetical protein